MSLITLKAFFEKVEGNKALQAKVKAASAKGMSKEVADELIQIAKAEGFEITDADLAEANKGQEGIPTGEELSAEELEAVAGGMKPQGGSECCYYAKSHMPCAYGRY